MPISKTCVQSQNECNGNKAANLHVFKDCTVMINTISYVNDGTDCINNIMTRHNEYQYGLYASVGHFKMAQKLLYKTHRKYMICNKLFKQLMKKVQSYSDNKL